MVSLPSRPNLGPERIHMDKTAALNSASYSEFKHPWYAQARRNELKRCTRARHAPSEDTRVVPRYYYLRGKKNDPVNESMQLTLFMLVLMSKPSTKAVPPDMVSSPVNILNVVVFPAPLIPRRPKHSLMGIPRLKRSTATNGPRPGNQTQLYL